VQKASGVVSAVCSTKNGRGEKFGRPKIRAKRRMLIIDHDVSFVRMCILGQCGKWLGSCGEDLILHGLSNAGHFSPGDKIHIGEVRLQVLKTQILKASPRVQKERDEINLFLTTRFGYVCEIESGLGKEIAALSRVNFEPWEKPKGATATIDLSMAGICSSGPSDIRMPDQRFRNMD
jgi:hypothetical protein